MTKIKTIKTIIGERGFRYLYNYVHFFIFWNWIRSHPRLIYLMNRIAPYPSYLEVEATTKCPFKCVFCEHTYWNEKSRDMSLAEFKRFIDQFPRLKYIAFTGIGENFLNHDFMDMYRYLKVRHPTILIELYDMFYYIDKKVAGELINEIGLTQVYVSFDAATKETYEKVRVGSDFDRVVNNIRNFIRIREEEGLRFPQITFHFIITKQNMHEISQYIHLVKELGGNRIFFTRLLHRFEEVKDLWVNVPQSLMDEANKVGEDCGVEIEWNMDVPRQKPAISNCIEWTTPFIYVTGEVQPCCCLQEANNRKKLKSLSLGNIYNSGFRDIWRGKGYKELRRQILRGKIPEICRGCPIYNLNVKKTEGEE